MPLAIGDGQRSRTELGALPGDLLHALLPPLCRDLRNATQGGGADACKVALFRIKRGFSRPRGLLKVGILAVAAWTFFGEAVLGGMRMSADVALASPLSLGKRGAATAAATALTASPDALGAVRGSVRE